MNFVLTDSAKVSARPVSATDWQGTQWIIEEGLQAGDKVLVDGAQKIRPDAPVRSVAYDPKSDTTLAIRSDSAISAPPSAAPPLETGVVGERR